MYALQQCCWNTESVSLHYMYCVWCVCVWYVGMQVWMGSLEEDFNERQNSLNLALAREPQ